MNMWKKILASFLICSALLTIGSISHATGETNVDIIKPKSEISIEKKEILIDNSLENKKVDLSKYQVTSPEEKSYTSKDRIAFINGKAPSGTFITMEVYGTTDLTRKVFNLFKLPTDEDYIETYREEMEVGNMGFFDKQLELVTGINKIVINFNIKEVPSEEIIIFVEPKAAKPNREVKLTDIMTLIR